VSSLLTASEKFFVEKIVELLRIFAEGATNLYRIAKLPGWNNPTAGRYIRYCLKQGYIEFDHEEDDKGLPAKFYRITMKGRDFLETAPSSLPPAEKVKEPEKKPRREEKGTGIFIRTA